MKTLFKSQWLLPVLSGIFIGTSYIPFPPWASIFGFIPLWIFWEQQTRLRNVILSSILCTFVYTLIGFNWVTYLLHEYAHVPWFVAVLGMLLFALFAHLFVPVAGMLWFIGRKHRLYSGWQSILAMGLLTALSLWAIPMLFKWNFGYAWYGANIPLYHLAEYIGFSGLSMLTVLANVPLYMAWQNKKEKAGRVVFIRVLIIFLTLNVFGLSTKAWQLKPDASFNTLLVQANIGNAEKMAAEFGRGFYDEILNKYQAATDKGLDQHADSRVDFILWSETAFPSLLNREYQDNYFSQQLIKYINTRQVALITGAYAKDPDSGLITNSLFILDNKGQVQSSYYSKTILLAFGEYIPGEEQFPIFREWLPMVGHFGRGQGPTELLALKDYKIGPQICYESLYPDFSRSLADLGAQFIVNVTNDSWYGTWQEPYQHMYMTLARAIETRRPLVRVTNTGISTVVLASGEVLQQSPMHQEWAGLYTVPYLKEPKATFYQRYYALMPEALLGILCLLIINGFRLRAKPGEL
ncbi:apolipoprotein N-acyltransferase [Methyloprofundus sedimenti]|uniref:Apolipoprotein N-acyltransferase n=1 Tax=Methyloprofundus sedimenti TaxID=1420851 RepID=A0A1V8M6J7_9GAMM|nr:apolipoprotein N-acyltransferase [Methyloprofundus sedimenti]OQK17191.1 apolipoprotein N-acyltransferase [Methyloprofundus sedimenti]